MITVLIGKSLASEPLLASFMNCRSDVAGFHFVDEQASLPEIVEEVSSTHGTDGMVFLLTGPPVDQSLPGESLRMYRILVGKDAGKEVTAPEIVIDDYSRLAALHELGNYPGLSHLVNHTGWTEEDYKAMIIQRYGHALEAMREKKVAAVFGAQRLGERVAESLKSCDVDILCYVDNNQARHGGKLDGIDICGLSDLKDKTTPVIIGTTRFETSISRQLKEQGFSNVIPYPVMSLYLPESFPGEIPYLGIQKDLALNPEKYVELFLALEDEKSRQVLDGLIQSRLTYDSSMAERVSDDCNRQYFDEWLVSYSEDEVYVDLGGYDGDTAEKYVEYSGGRYKKMYLFEPDRNLLDRAVSRLSGCERIEYIAAGAYSRNGVLKFEITGTTNGAIVENGELEIPVRTLDSVIREVPSIIKMDIEGSETEALIGGRAMIAKYRPKLAVAAYHYADDLWRLKRVIQSINPDYHFYLRHYSETGLESVLYAI